MKQHSDASNAESARIRTALDGVFANFLHARKAWAGKQKHSADDFNLFEVMGVQNDELSHSRVLAWLLDHRIEKGSHAQGNLGFRLFLEDLQRDFKKDILAFAKEPNYWVSREVSGKEARVDIEIAARGKFLIFVENKIQSMEGEEQTDREWRDLQERAKELGVCETACVAIFLTLDGGEARNSNFVSLGWQRIIKVLGRFADLAEPSEVKLFVRHYAKALSKLVVAERPAQEASNVEF
jgi:hypothetical protein